MQITLEVVRQTLRQALGHDSFVAVFIKTVEETASVPSAAISADGTLRYNPDFTRRYVNCEEDLFCLVMHEIMHPMFGHFIYKSGRIENLAADMVINASISLFFSRASGEGGPDGMTVDAEGYVWSARWDGSRLVRYAPDGRQVLKIDFPVKKVSSVIFGGADYTDMYITTAGGDKKESDGEHAGALFHLNLNIRGVPEFFSRVWLSG